ncbi:MAG: hypothetical protein ACK5LO_12125, partial [Leucobacter sp.]
MEFIGAAEATTADRIAQVWPVVLMTVGLAFLAAGVLAYVQSRSTHGWTKTQGVVQNKARGREETQVELEDGRIVTAENYSGSVLKPGRRIGVVIDPQNPERGRTLRQGRTP